MSGPFDVPDDPDDVTLWAGRLRAWPTPPVESAATDDPDDVDDDTAISPRNAPADDTVRVARNAPADDTVRVARDAPADDTVRVARDAPADDTVRVPRPQPVPPAPEVVDDETVRVSPPASSRGPVENGIVDETTIPGRRRGVAPEDEASTDPDDEASTGDTAAGTRRARSRPRVEEPEIPSGDPVPTPRGARIPTTDHELYRPRADQAIRVTRTAVPARSTDAPDAAAVRPRDVRRTRGRGALLVAAAVLVLAVAAVAVFLVMG
ncbi:MAG: hypothetical protein DI639_17815 [Leifsonia xyli]|nr:MAG: hypothetical protein DI639_17815 [Leifsonia xyli]